MRGEVREGGGKVKAGVERKSKGKGNMQILE